MVATSIKCALCDSMNGETVIVTISLPTEMAARVDEVRDRQHNTRSGVIKQALDLLFKALEAPAEPIAAAFEENGLKGGTCYFEAPHRVRPLADQTAPSEALPYYPR